MFGDIDAWLDNISVSTPYIEGGSRGAALSLLSDIQELSFDNNGEAVRVALNRVKFLLDLDPGQELQELERRIVAKLMRYQERKGFNVAAVSDEGERYDTSDHATALGHIFAVDQACLHVRSHVDGVDREHTILLIPGNGEDIIADYSYSVDDVDGFDKVMHAFEPPKELA